MHDLDYSGREFEFEEPTDSFESFEYGEGPEGEFEGEGAFEFETPDMPLSPAEEMEMATDLLGVSSEAELDQFLGKVFRRITKGAKRFFRSGVGRALGGALRGVARKVLPMAGGALGSLIAPGIGGVIGSKLASSAGRIFGLELEGLSPEDQEFEAAKRFVRLAADAANQALRAGRAGADPVQVARQALVAAARRHAPGLLAEATGGASAGRWERRGRTIILYGV